MLQRRPLISPELQLSLLLTLALCIGGYWILRYNGQSLEGDTISTTFHAQRILSSQHLVQYGRGYHAGFGYPAILAFIGNTTGFSIQQIQQYATIWMAAFALMAFVCYREITGGTIQAFLAVVLLFGCPDFLMYILRGTPEKLTWFYGLSLLFLLSRSYTHLKDIRKFAVYVLMFYFVLWAMVTTHVYFASSFLIALIFAYAGNQFFSRLKTGPDTGSIALATSQRLLVISLSGLVLVVIFINYIYAPALGFYRTLANVFERTAVMALSAEPAAQPYQAISNAWRSPLVYGALVAGEVALLVGSIAQWSLQLWQFIRYGWHSVALQKRLLWSIYSGFAAQMLLGIIVDFSGALSSNLQLRLSPPFVMVASPMTAQLLFAERRKVRHTARFAIIIMALLVFYLVITSLLKATNDPSVGNLWIFYLDAEVNAFTWLESHVRDSQVWIDVWSHLRDVYSFQKGYQWAPNNLYRFGKPDASYHYVMISNQTRLQAYLMSQPLPSTVEYRRVYDNGEVQIYHRRPRTPYQR